MKRIPLFFFLTAMVAILLYKLEIDFIILCILFLLVIFFIANEQIQRLLLLLFLFFLLVTLRIDAIAQHTNEDLELNPPELFTGKVVSYPRYKDDYVSFILQLQESKEKVQARIYDNTQDLFYGDMISFNGVIKTPKGKRNPGGFDYRQYLKARNIHYVININNNSVYIDENKENNLLLKWTLSLRKELIHIIDRSFEGDKASFLKGIILGEKALDAQLVTDFNQIGISHILAVSGLHVGYLYVLLYWLSRLLKCSKLLEFIFITVMLYIYSFIVGFSISIIRASVMLGLLIFSQVINKKYDSINVLSLLGAIFLCINPYTLFTSGFQLSFSCVLSIAIFYPYLDHKIILKHKLLNYLKSLILLTISVQIGILPLMIFHFGTISLITIIANVLIVPIVGIIIILFIIYLFLHLIIGFSPFVISIIDSLISLIFSSTHILNNIPFTKITSPPLSINMLVYYYIFLFMFIGYFYVFKHRNRQLIVGILSINTIIMLCIYIIIPQPLKVTILDVRQGDSILIETPNNKNILIDGGGQYNYSVGNEIIKPVILYKHISKLDLVISTHTHNDHLLGILDIIGEIPIEGIITNCLEGEDYSELRAKSERYKIPVFTNDMVDVDLSDELSFVCLYPEPYTEYLDENNSSVVVKLNYKNVSFLFTGDLEEEGEQRLLQSNNNIKSQVLKIGHHGSNTSSTEEFLDRVEPTYAIISVGENNYFGHPSQQVIDALEKSEIKTYRTDQYGAIEIVTYGSEIHIRGYDTKGE